MVLLSVLALVSSPNIIAKKKRNVPLKLLFEPMKVKKYNNKIPTKTGKSRKNKSRQSCNFKIIGFEDRRQNKKTIGVNLGKPLLIDDVRPWLNDASEQILKRNLETDDVANRLILVEPKLTRLYSYAQNMNIHGVSALHVDFRENGSIIDSRHYRSLGSTINWNNGSHEYLDAVESSLKQVYWELLYDLTNFCNTDTKEYSTHVLK